MSADWFIPSYVGWFARRPDAVIDEIARQSNIDRNMFRPDIVDDATLRNRVPAAAQRLLRWSTTGPEEVFWTGFLPPVFPDDDTYPAGAYNLRTYVATNHPSIFVSTTQPYHNSAGRLTRWERRLTRETQHRFEYEIFTYGGIDVNRVLGDHEYANQHEVAFPGGILPTAVRSAREYMGTQIIRIWENTLFDNTVNLAHAPPLSMLPAVRHTPRDALVVSYPDVTEAERPVDEHPELRRGRAVAVSDSDELMHGDGDGAVDDLYDATPIPRSRVSCALYPPNHNRAFFFCGNRYAVINIKPGTNEDTIAWGPKSIGENWPSLSKASFAGGVDAVLPNPKNKEEMYFFCAENYALVDTKPGTTDDYIINGPKKIATEWPSLNKAGFQIIDAVLPHPSNKEEAYFFSGELYALINIKPGTNGDYIVNGPKSIWDNWPSLKAAGFKTVDAILPHPANHEEAYFFSGDRYALINIKPGSTDDYIVNGPKAIRTEWPSLHKCGFW